MSSPRSTEFDDIYFSPDDGPAETEHVFLRGNNLPAAWDGRARFTIAELGFGTGLNFLLAARIFTETAPAGAMLDYVAVEKFPLTPPAIDSALRPFAARLGAGLLDRYLENYPPRIPGVHRIQIGAVHLTLIFDDIMKALPQAVIPRGVDCWFLDGFAPAKNPDMWSTDVFMQMARLSAAGATLATFTVAGAVRRGLAEAGFTVEKTRGFGRKREMLTGRFTQEKQKENINNEPQRIAIIGAGLAGTALAARLRARGMVPVIYEAAAAIAPGASGNPVGLCNPRLAALRLPQADLFFSGYARAVKMFPQLDAGFVANGNMHLMQSAERKKKFTGSAANWGWAREHLQLLDEQAASDAAGVTLPCGGVLLPDAGTVDPAALCRAYATDTEIRTGVAAAPQSEGTGWRVGDDIYDAVVLANGCAVKTVLPDLPLQAVRGQITFVTENAESAALKTNLCYGGYIGAAREGMHTVGATFQRGQDDVAVCAEDDAANMAGLAAILPAWGSMNVSGARAAARCAARDRFPVAGAVETIPGLYVSTAHGSHGIVTSLAAAEFIADLLSRSPWSLPLATGSLLSPARFLRVKG